MNLRALRLLFPRMRLEAIEINTAAAARLREFLPPEYSHEGSMLDFRPQRRWDLAFVKGVLIDIDPASLQTAYASLAASRGRYLLLAEYYNPFPDSIEYRGHVNRLLKRDFARKFLDAQPEFALLYYESAYRRDPDCPQDDITRLLMELRDA